MGILVAKRVFVLQVHHPLHWTKYCFELEFNSLDGTTISAAFGHDPRSSNMSLYSFAQVTTC